jgi:hypothetical protein
MAYQPLNGSSEDACKAIYLYTTPLKKHSHVWKLKKPRDIFAHWAICIQGRCYELTINADRTKKTKNEPKYKVKSTDEQQWKQMKEKDGRECKRTHAANMSKLYPKATIEIVGAYKSSG